MRGVVLVGLITLASSCAFAAPSAEQLEAIASRTSECWTKSADSSNLENLQIWLTVTTDSAGKVRIVRVADQDKGRLSDPRFRFFAEQAMRAVLDPRCADLLLPANMLGTIQVLTFRFRP